jgi:quercetin dioxygenase-like cupin family protein
MGRSSARTKERDSGDKARRLTAVGQGPVRLFHRHGAYRSAEPASGAGAGRHTHPFGQTLIVTAGCGWVQRDGVPIEVIRPGDVVWFPAGEKHWHGATATTAMSHIAIQEALNGSPVTWMEKVSDEQYQAGPKVG